MAASRFRFIDFMEFISKPNNEEGRPYNSLETLNLTLIIGARRGTNGVAL